MHTIVVYMHTRVIYDYTGYTGTFDTGYIGTFNTTGYTGTLILY
jgi:hypothetical protein